MKMGFEEKSFVVIGAGKSTGIGFVFIRELLASGVQVIELINSILFIIQIIYFFQQKIAILDITEPSDAINEAKHQYANATILFYKVDVRKRKDIENAFKAVINVFGYVDVLCNFAGILNETKIEDVIDINLVSFFFKFIPTLFLTKSNDVRFYF